MTEKRFPVSPAPPAARNGKTPQIEPPALSGPNLSFDLPPLFPSRDPRPRPRPKNTANRTGEISRPRPLAFDFPSFAVSPPAPHARNGKTPQIGPLVRWRPFLPPPERPRLRPRRFPPFPGPAPTPGRRDHEKSAPTAPHGMPWRPLSARDFRSPAIFLPRPAPKTAPPGKERSPQIESLKLRRQVLVPPEAPWGSISRLLRFCRPAPARPVKYHGRSKVWSSNGTSCRPASARDLRFAVFCGKTPGPPRPEREKTGDRRSEPPRPHPRRPAEDETFDLRRSPLAAGPRPGPRVPGPQIEALGPVRAPGKNQAKITRIPGKNQNTANKVETAENHEIRRIKQKSSQNHEIHQKSAKYLK